MIDIKINQILYVFLYIPDIYYASRYQNMYNVKRYQSIGIFCSQPNRYIPFQAKLWILCIWNLD